MGRVEVFRKDHKCPIYVGIDVKPPVEADIFELLPEWKTDRMIVGRQRIERHPAEVLAAPHRGYQPCVVCVLVVVPEGWDRVVVMIVKYLYLRLEPPVST
jgi:hypothetical protein